MSEFQERRQRNQNRDNQDEGIIARYERYRYGGGNPQFSDAGSLLSMEELDEDDERVLNLGGVSSKQRLEELANQEDDIDRSANDKVDRRLKREVEKNRAIRERATNKSQSDTEQIMGEREHRGFSSNSKSRRRGIFDKYEEYRYGGSSEYGEDLYQSSYTGRSYEEQRAIDEETVYNDGEDEEWTFITEEEYQAQLLIPVIYEDKNYD